MLRYFIGRAFDRRWAHPRLIVCAPSGVTEVEKRAVEEAALGAGAWPTTCAETLGAELARVPAGTGDQHHRLCFFTVETAFLRRYYVLCFIELASRRVHLAGCSAHPSGRWVSQQARNLSFSGVLGEARFLIHDRDSKFLASFDGVFHSEGVRVILTPFQAPKANAYAERFVRTARAECLDWLLILGERQLDRVLRVFVEHYHHERPHRALGRCPPAPLQPLPPPRPRSGAAVGRRDQLGGLLHEYYLAVA